MKKGNVFEYKRDLYLKTKEMKDRASSHYISYDDAVITRKKEKVLYQKYLFASNFIKAKDKMEKENGNRER